MSEETLRGFLAPLLEAEEVPLLDASGRVLAQELRAAVPLDLTIYIEPDIRRTATS